jgi:hypothetical protein
MSCYGADQRPVIAIRQCAEAPVLAQRDTPPPGDDLAVIEYQHVELREVRLGPADVRRADRVMKDKFRPYNTKRLTGLVIEITAVPCRDDL